ncbi:hypothetical protein AB0O64_37950, partial [Streptomyces sp. NPDC088341]|uniref:hypothetical protein n=1 Tax=Streptomyces sp. NPDC088341 TaxID=3154870 RepID=UPI00342C6D61
AAAGVESTSTGPDSGHGDHAGVTPALFQEPEPWEVEPPENAPPAPKPPAERSLDEFPAEIRDYVKGLRKDAADYRIKAKTAAEEAEAQFAAERDEWIGNLLKATGLMPDIEDADDEPADPAEQVASLTEQLAERTTEHQATQSDLRSARVELAVWKGAHEHGANPGRLTDSRRFMKQVAALDPGADDFGAKVAAAIGTAVKSDPYYRADQPAGQAPTTPPPVPSGGDFAGGPSGGKTEPQSVDDYRALLRKKTRGGSD